MGTLRRSMLGLGSEDRGILRLILLGFLILLVVVVGGAWAGANAYAAHWIATHGVIKTGEGSPPTGSQDVVYAPRLHAWFTPPAAGRATVVIAHGYQADRSHHAAEAATLRRLGYGTLQNDFAYVGGKQLDGGGGRG